MKYSREFNILILTVVCALLVLAGHQAAAQTTFECASLPGVQCPPSIGVMMDRDFIQLNGFVGSVSVIVTDQAGHELFNSPNYPIDDYETTIYTGVNMGKSITVRVIEDSTQGEKNLVIPDLTFTHVDTENGVIEGVGPDDANIWLYNLQQDMTYPVLHDREGHWIANIGEAIDLSETWFYGFTDTDGDEVTGRIRDLGFNYNISFNYIEIGFPVEGASQIIYVDDDGVNYQNDYFYKKIVQYTNKLPYFEYQLVDFNVEPGMVVTLEYCGLTKSVEVPDILITEIDLTTGKVSGTGPEGFPLTIMAADPNTWDDAVRYDTVENGLWEVDFTQPGDNDDEQNTMNLSESTVIGVHWFGLGIAVEQDVWPVPQPDLIIEYQNENQALQFYNFTPGGDIKLSIWDPERENNLYGAKFQAGLDGSVGPYYLPPDAPQLLTPGNWIWATDAPGRTVALQISAPPEIVSLSAPTNPVEFGSEVIAQASFTDPDSDSWTITWDWGDGAISHYSSEEQSLQTTHTYPASGIYQLSLTVEDEAGFSDTETFSDIVIYQPESGFITGAGIFDSPPGAFKGNENISGKAHFTVVTKYQPGATVPIGNTSFKLKGANIRFDSSSYDWLVVNGNDYARIKGTGMINGEGKYMFLIWAGDGESDTFRIKIWEEDGFGNETVIYDNGFAQEIARGIIYIHDN